MRRTTIVTTLLTGFLTLSGVRVMAQQEPQELQPAAPTVEEARMADYDNPRQYTINEIKIFGVRYLSTSRLAATTGLQPGMQITIPGDAISQAVSRLWNQRYFSDVKVIADILDDERVDIEIYLQERPRVYNWYFEGVRKGEASTLLEDELKLKRGSELSDYVIEKNINLIKKYLAGKGFRNAEVAVRIENDPVVQNAVNVTFVIDKHKRVKIGAIEFEGNEVFSDKRLRKTFKKTHKVNPNFFQKFKLDEQDYDDDKENLLDFYNSQGYRNAVIVRDSIYTISDNRIGINIKVEEGDKFYIRNVTWIGNTEYSTEYLQRMLGIEKGDTYDKRTLHKRLGIGRETNIEDMSQIWSQYQNNGYLRSVIQPDEIVVGKDSIDLQIKIFEGRPFTINNVEISGNERINDEVIRREIYTRPGELYNRALIMQTLRQLGQMGHFDPASMIPQINPVGPELVDISWPVAEIASDQVQVSAGYGAGMFVGSLGLRLNNFALKNTFKKGAWRPYPQGQNQQLALQLQTNGSYYTSFMGSFTEPWLGGKKPNALTIAAYYSNQTNSYSFGGVFYKSNSFFRTTGVSAGLGQRLSLPDPYFSIYNELGYTRYHLRDWNMFHNFSNGISNIFTFKTVFGRSTIINPIYPNSGSDFSLSLALTPPYSLFDKRDYSTMADDDPRRFKWIEYHKWKAKAQWFLPLTPDQKLVVMARAEMGYLGHYNKYRQSPFEGFDVGGDGMVGYNVYGVDVIGLRGYSDGDLTPFDPQNPSNDMYANVYNKYTLELRYPFLQQGQTSIYGLIFAEAGNGYRDWHDFDPFRLHRSLGAGVRVYLPMIGMIGVDWGYGFDGTKRSSTPHGGKFHFTIGMDF